MADELVADDIGGPPQDLDVFECPKCGQTIDVSADVCRFCGAKIDHAAAREAAHLLARVDQACNDASIVRYLGGTAICVPIGIGFGVLRHPQFILRVGFLNFVLVFCALILVISAPFPFLSLRWWGKYAKLVSDDEDFQSARGIVRKAGAAGTASLVTFGALLALILILKATHW